MVALVFNTIYKKVKRLVCRYGIVHCVAVDEVLSLMFLNQVRAGHRPAHTWFLKIDPVQIVGMRVCVCVCVCVCVRARGY